MNRTRSQWIEVYKSKGWKLIPVKNKVRITTSNQEFDINSYDGDIAVLTGHESNLCVVDVDNKGVSNLRSLEIVKELDAEKTKVCRTQNGGLHYYFSIPPNTEVRNAQDIFGTKTNEKWAVDIRGNGGYVVLPPSEGYVWENNFPVKPLAKWIVNKITSSKKEESAFLKDIKGLSEGEGRHEAALRVIGSYIKLGLKNELLWQTVIGWNQLNKPPLPEEWLDAKIQYLLEKKDEEVLSDAKPDICKQLIEYKEYLNRKIKNPTPEFTTGFKKLDETIWGWVRQELITIGGAPNSGKTLFMLKSIVDNIDKGKKVLFFPTEANSNSIISRILSLKFSTNTKSLRSGLLDDHQINSLQEEQLPYLMGLKDKLYIVNQNAPSIKNIEDQIKITSPDIIYIDYFQHCYLNKESHKEAEDFVMTLKKLCKDNNCPILIASQVHARSFQDKNSGDWKTAETKATDLRTTQALWFISDIVIAVNRRVNEAQTEVGTMLSVEKAKDSDFCKVYLKLNKTNLQYEELTRDDYYSI